VSGDLLGSDDQDGLLWPEVSGAAAAVVSVLVAALVWRVAANPFAWVPVLDDANLIFHEAGHPVYGILGSTFELYGGTLGQLTFPVIAAGNFWLKRQPVSAALAGVWLFENFFNIARYMADARAQILPLVGGGEHDWFHIFSRWGVLVHDYQIANTVRFFGYAGLAGCVAWLWWLRRRSNPAS